MLNKIFNYFQQLFLRYTVDLKLNPYAISVLTLVNFYIFCTIYAVFVYVQFPILEVLSVSLVFLIIFLFLIIIFCPTFYNGNAKFSGPNIFWSIIIFNFLLLVLHSQNPTFDVYYRTFPTFEFDNNYGYHIDSAYHVSIINSINLFGIPSTGLNDVPVLKYHVLSHYVDALIIKITGLNAWETYGLFYYFKCILLISSLLILISLVCKKFELIFLLSIFFLIPIVVSSWYAVASHSLWFTSLIVILSSPLIYKIISIKENIQIKHYLLLSIILIFISLGKISSGFMYAYFVGIIIFFKNFKNPRTYFFIFLFLSFFIFYYFYYSYPGQININNYEKNLNNIFWLTKNLINNYYIFLFFASLFFLFRTKQIILFIVSFCLSYLIIYLINIFIELDENSNRYFYYGLWSTSIFIFYQLIINVFSTNNKLNYKIFFTLLLFWILPQIDSTKFNFFNSSFKIINEIKMNFILKPFKNLNEIDPGLQVTIKKLVLNRNYIPFDKYPKYIANININLNKFIKLNKLSKKNSLLFIPEEAFYKHQAEKIRSGDSYWGLAQLIYAVTGVPLVHGLKEREKADVSIGTYGRDSYDNSALWVNKKDFDPIFVCSKFKKNIIILNNLNKPDLKLVKCTK